ncbi:ATP-binding cassette domain-containing protein [Mycoplasmopsis hyopharyngis]|uniref:ATP-binding cassette domain-containing protein n=1 Tax=Mycoplasmopsis hyopharyngis TaxID=29558 RepID=UPI003872F5C3
MKSKKPILQIENLKKYFINNGFINKAVDNVTFNVHEGEIVGLIGESGSGKTTVGRSLLRLYENYNGFVKLSDKIISGKTISKDNRRFLRKNIQMIFQDPHAALNGQKNIYSILAEPLIVNKIISNQLKDIFKDWDDVKRMFHYTFSEKVLNLELENLKVINDLSKEFFGEWEEKFKSFEYDSTSNYEDNFNNLYDYLEEKQNIESEIINNMYSNLNKMMAYYFESQQAYRDKKLDIDENEYLAAIENYEKTLTLTRMSNETYEAFKEIDHLVIELKEAIKEKKQFRLENKSAFLNFLGEYKNEIRLNNIAKNSTYDLEYWYYNLKQKLLNKKLLLVIEKAKKEFKYLSLEQIKILIKELEKYKELFYKENLCIPLTDRKIGKKINKIIEQNFNFDLSKFVIENTQNYSYLNDRIDSFKKQILEKQIASKTFKQNGATSQELKEAEARLEQTAAKHKEAVQEFVSKQKSIVQDLKEKIVLERQLYESLKNKQTFTNQRFDIEFKNFLKKLNSDLQELKAKKQKSKVAESSILINQYKEKVFKKKKTLLSFDYENKYLIKDTKVIKFLLGIQANSFIKTIVKIPNRYIKNFILKFLIKRKLSNLLTKTKIYKALEEVGLLKQFAYRYPHEFSGGQRQRIVIARALITQPKVIVADEPIASLDISIQAQVVNLLKKLCKTKNIGMLFIAHDLSMIEYIADRVEIMHLGKIVESGETEIIYSNPVHPYTINLFKAIPKISNANEKFENINFELDYLKEQRFPNVPKYYKIETNHYIYGTEEQLTKWTSQNSNNLFIEQIDPNTIASDLVDKNLPYDGNISANVNEQVNYTEVIDLDKTSVVEVNDFAFDKTEEIKVEEKPKKTTRRKKETKK